MFIFVFYLIEGKSRFSFIKCHKSKISKKLWKGLIQDSLPISVAIVKPMQTYDYSHNNRIDLESKSDDIKSQELTIKKNDENH